MNWRSDRLFWALYSCRPLTSAPARHATPLISLSLYHFPSFFNGEQACKCGQCKRRRRSKTEGHPYSPSYSTLDLTPIYSLSPSSWAKVFRPHSTATNPLILVPILVTPRSLLFPPFHRFRFRHPGSAVLHQGSAVLHQTTAAASRVKVLLLPVGGIPITGDVPPCQRAENLRR